MAISRQGKMIWVKRTFVATKEVSYIQIPLIDYDVVVINQHNRKAKGQKGYMFIEKAPFYYGFYRDHKANIIKGFWFIIGATVSAYIAILLAKHLG